MKKRDRAAITQLCRPLSEIRIVKAVWVFGSSVSKKKGNDIDLLILIDDTDDEFEKKESFIEGLMQRMLEKTNLNIHFQKLMKLSNLWSLLIKGEPWIITALKKPLVIYDPHHYLELIQKALKKKRISGKELKSERLTMRSEEFLTQNRELFIHGIEELFLAAMESAQIFLLLKKKILYEPRKILREIEKYGDAGPYYEILQLAEKAQKGTLSDFKGEDLEYYTKQTLEWMRELKESVTHH